MLTVVYRSLHTYGPVALDIKPWPTFSLIELPHFPLAQKIAIIKLDDDLIHIPL